MVLCGRYRLRITRWTTLTAAVLRHFEVPCSACGASLRSISFTINGPRLSADAQEPSSPPFRKSAARTRAKKAIRTSLLPGNLSA